MPPCGHPGHTAPVSGLLDIARQVAAAARTSGALAPIRTQETLVEDAGVRFSVRQVTRLRAKPRADRRATRVTNPFLPPDPRLLVAELGPHYRCVLNKYPVLADHLLLVTRRFAPQDAILGPTDFEALFQCLHSVDGLGFYNGGTVAGASQPHRHLQLVPLPLGFPPVPIRAAPRLPFQHAAGAPGETASQAHATYLDLLAACALHPAQPAPYNLLVTRDWMMVVPRSRECFQGISINALGFAGLLLARDAAEAAVLAAGPMRALQAVAPPPAAA